MEQSESKIEEIKKDTEISNEKGKENKNADLGIEDKPKESKKIKEVLPKVKKTNQETKPKQTEDSEKKIVRNCSYLKLIWLK